MRKYEQVWNLIKESPKTKEKCVVLTAHPLHHARIKKAVGKEKTNDLGYAEEMAEKGLLFRLDMESKGSRLTFKLIIKDDITFI